MPGEDPEWEAESDEIIQALYEDALVEGEAWAEEAYERRSTAL